MKGICPNCEKERELELIHGFEDIQVRGEKITVEEEYFKCLSCGEEFEDPRSEDDPLDKAYREYRSRHGMIQPEGIRNLRKRYGLTQHEMARILGWGLATLSRYENGALQDEAHDKILRLAMEPNNLLRLIEDTPNVLPKEKRSGIIEQLRATEEMEYSLAKVYEDRFGRYEADALSGYKKLNLAKLLNVILFFCEEGVLKTVLNKHLFYSDFNHFKEYALSITGSRYANAPYGPVPDKWEYYLSLLVDENELCLESVFFDNNIIGDRYVTVKKPDLSLFENSELLILTKIKEYFKGWTATKISNFSHDEKGYKQTPKGKGDFITYDYAADLQI